MTLFPALEDDGRPSFNSPASFSRSSDSHSVTRLSLNQKCICRVSVVQRLLLLRSRTRVPQRGAVSLPYALRFRSRYLRSRGLEQPPRAACCNSIWAKDFIAPSTFDDAVLTRERQLVRERLSIHIQASLEAGFPELHQREQSAAEYAGEPSTKSRRARRLKVDQPDVSSRSTTRHTGRPRFARAAMAAISAECAA